MTTTTPAPTPLTAEQVEIAAEALYLDRFARVSSKPAYKWASEYFGPDTWDRIRADARAAMIKAREVLRGIVGRGAQAKIGTFYSAANAAAWQLTEALNHAHPAADDEGRGTAFNEGQDRAADFIFEQMTEMLGLATFVPQDGTETWEGDVVATLRGILVAAQVIDDETGAVAKHAHPADAGAERVIAGLNKQLTDEIAATRSVAHKLLASDKRVRALEEAVREYMAAVERAFDWMNGNDLVADHSEQCPEDYDRINAASERLRAALEPQP